MKDLNEKKLVIKFKGTNRKTANVTINAPKESITPDEIKIVGDAVVTGKMLDIKNDEVAALDTAKLIKTNIEFIWPPTLTILANKAA